MSLFYTIFFVILLLPIVGPGLSYLNIRWKWFPVLGMALALLGSIWLTINNSGHVSIMGFEWLPGIQFSWRLDNISISLISLVMIISFLIHLFSMFYMEDDPGIKRYFLKLGFFTSSMIGLLAADHLLLLFIFWELVGFSSYLLIGFWYRDSKNALSGRVAFITNRVADLFLLSSILIIWSGTGSAQISQLSVDDLNGGSWFLVGMGIVLGACGKSAQFPFYNWLPRAMAGPTPVSALIHAATMVAAGVYLLVRLDIILLPEVRIVTALVGSVTMVIAAISAIAQTDIKSVLAYSTISQLGYMVMAVGVGAKEMALFHLWTHAFFKAGLFLCAGVIIHFLHQWDYSTDAQDMRKMGGLRRILPYTSAAYLICMLSLSGLPLFSGFISKEGIILAVYQSSAEYGVLSYLILFLAVLGVFLTAFYMTRQAYLTFLGEPRIEKAGIKILKEPWLTVRLPILILAIGSMWVFYSLNPFGHATIINYWYDIKYELAGSASWVLTFITLILSLGGILISFRKVSSKINTIDHYQAYSIGDKLSYYAFYLDSFYHNKVVIMVNQVAGMTSYLDKRIIDPIIDWTGMGFVVFSKLIDILDKVLVDKIVELTAIITTFLGDVIRLFHSRRVQLHVFWTVIGAILILMWINIFETT